MHQYRNREVLSGLFLSVLAIGFLWQGRKFEFGTFEMMGPGFVPLSLAMVLLALGVAIAFSGIRKAQVADAPAMGQWAYKPLVLVLGSIVLYGAFLSMLGYAVATALLVLVSGLAAPDRRWKEALVSAIVVSGVTAFAFVEMLGLPMPLLPEILR